MLTYGMRTIQDNDKAVKEFMKKWAEKGSRVTAAEVAKSLR